MNPVVAESFGPYRLLDLIGRGGMGEVWRAVDTRKSDRVVALKLLPVSLASSEDFTSRFRREAHTAARLSDPHVVPIHDYGEIDGRLFIDMRMVDGDDLGALIRRSAPFDPARAVAIVEQVADALDAAHAAGLVHRDVKPSNILISSRRDRDFAYLIDFGITHVADATTITANGSTLGTLTYMAPERIDGEDDGDRRVDVYALGCVLHEMLTGHPAVSGHNVASIMYAHLQTPPPRPSDRVAGLPEALDDVVATAMAKDPDDRFDRAGQLADAARAALGGAVGQAPPGTTYEPPPRSSTDVGYAGTARTETAPGGRWRGDTTTVDSDAADAPDDAPDVLPAAPAASRGRRRVVVALVAVLAVGLVAVVAVVARWSSPAAGSLSTVALRQPDAAAVERATPTGATPVSVALSKDGTRAYTANSSADTVSVIDTATARVLATIPVGAAPWSVAVTPDGARAYVANSGNPPEDCTVSVIDTATASVVATIEVGRRPMGIAAAPDGRTVYVANAGSQDVSVIDVAAGRVTATVDVGTVPSSLAVSPDGRWVYTAGSNSVQVVDTARTTLARTMGVGSENAGIAVTPDGREILVTNHRSGRVEVIDAASGAATGTIDTGPQPYAVAVAPDGGRAYVASYSTGTISVVDLATNEVVATRKDAISPNALAVGPDGTHLYVADNRVDTVLSIPLRG